MQAGLQALQLLLDGGVSVASKRLLDPNHDIQGPQFLAMQAKPFAQNAPHIVSRYGAARQFLAYDYAQARISELIGLIVQG